MPHHCQVSSVSVSIVGAALKVSRMKLVLGTTKVSVAVCVALGVCTSTVGAVVGAVVGVGMSRVVVAVGVAMSKVGVNDSIEYI